jgi:hypothetical protein
MFWWGLLIGLFIGANVGVFVAELLFGDRRGGQSMETIKIFCYRGHIVAEFAVVAGECFFECGQNGVVAYPAQKEIHLPRCCRCVAEEEMERLEREVSHG